MPLKYKMYRFHSCFMCHFAQTDFSICQKQLRLHFPQLMATDKATQATKSLPAAALKNHKYNRDTLTARWKRWLRFLKPHHKVKWFKRLTISPLMSHQVEPLRLMPKLQWTDVPLWALASSSTQLLNRNHSTAASSAAGRRDRHLCWQRWQRLSNRSQETHQHFITELWLKHTLFTFISRCDNLWDLHFTAVRRRQKQ